mmetsp:Transcript_5291/g.14855  ORF Transcript_5291/g.14855 Transcript_5291/m.14855 type:complete len:138 (+) Transcript_5291:2072-2485(+)
MLGIRFGWHNNGGSANVLDHKLVAQDGDPIGPSLQGLRQRPGEGDGRTMKVLGPVDDLGHGFLNAVCNLVIRLDCRRRGSLSWFIPQGIHGVGHREALVVCVVVVVVVGWFEEMNESLINPTPMPAPFGTDLIDPVR